VQVPLSWQPAALPFKLLCANSHVCFCHICVPYLCVYKPHFLIIYHPKLGCGLYMDFFFKETLDPQMKAIILLTTEPATPVLYVVKLPVETASVWDGYPASCCTCMNEPTYYRCIGIFWLHESTRCHRFPEVRRLWVTSLTSYCKCC
jgi:hypothetical protein